MIPALQTCGSLALCARVDTWTILFGLWFAGKELRRRITLASHKKVLTEKRELVVD